MVQKSSRNVQLRNLLLAFLLLSSAVISFPALAGIGNLGVSGSQTAASLTPIGVASAPSDGTSTGTVSTGILGAMMSYTSPTPAVTMSASIWTDQPDYPPGSIVTINGTGFIAFATVTVSLTQPNGTVNTWQVASDGAGNFTTIFVLDDLGGTYYVSATDGINTATTAFTDPPSGVKFDAITSSDSSGNSKTSFYTTDDVYANITVISSGSASSVSGNVYVNKSSSCTNNGALTDSSGGTEPVSYSDAGTDKVEVWAHPLTAGTYVLVIDTTGSTSGVYDNGKDLCSGPFIVTVSTVSMTLSYQVIGGGSPTAPTFTCGTFTQVLTTTPTAYNVPSGCSWSITNPLTSSGTTERWQSADSYLTGTASSAQTLVFHYYHQFNVTLQYRVSDSSTPAAPIVYYTQFGDNTKTTTAALDPLKTSFAWVDASTAVNYTNPLSGSSSTERWQTNLVISSGKSTVASSVGSSTSPIDPLYYHQFLVYFQYTVVGGGSPTAPTVYYTKFGSANTNTAATSSPPSDWVDAETSVLYTNPTSDSSSSERWQANYTTSSGQSVIDSSVSATETLNPSYYHQVNVTFGYTTNDGTTINSYTNLVNYTQFGTLLHISTDASGVLSKTSDWADAGTSVTYASPVSISSTERYLIDLSDTSTHTVISSVSSSSNSANPEYHHQFLLTVSVYPQVYPHEVDVGNVTRSPTGSDCSSSFPYMMSCWYDSGTSVTLTAANNVVVSSTLYIFSGWSDDLTGTTNPNSITMNAAHTVTANYDEYASGTGLVTDQSGCGFTIDSSNQNAFRLIFTPDPANPSSAFEVTATNPGQFGYNIFAVGTEGVSVTINIQIPYPFVTQGSNPIQVYSAVSLSSNGCFVPSDQISATSISVPNGITTPSGASGIDLNTYGSNNLPTDTTTGSFATITISGTIPSSGLFYVEIHLDYGLKPTSSTYFGGYAPSDQHSACNESPATSLDAVSTSSPSPICQLGKYQFSDTVSGNPISYSTIYNENDFKNDPGIAGLVLDLNSTPIQGVHVTVTGPNGFTYTTTTDQDGYFSSQFKYTGKAASFTITVDYGAITQSQTVTLKANHFEFVTFNLPVTLQ